MTDESELPPWILKEQAAIYGGNWSPQIFGRDQALFPRSRAGLGVWDPRVGTRMIATRERRNPSSSQPVTFGGFTIVPTIAMEVAVPASRAFWKGYLKLSFVSCPVALYPATSAAERVSFRQVNRRTGHRLRHKLVDSVTGE